MTYKVEDLNYSLMIPTRNRQRTAVAAVQSAVATDYPHLQIVVSDNSDDDSLLKMLRDAGLEKDKRVTYTKTDKVLSMRDNWENALDHATGDLLTVIGDDDAVLPETFLWANVLLARLDTEVLQGGYAIFKWDDYPFAGRQNYLQMRFNDELVKYNDPRSLLRGALNYRPQMGTGPGLYYGFVRRDFLEGLKKTRGRWIVDPVPDFDSGYATLMYAKSYGRAERCLFVSGHSGKSNSGSMRNAALFRKGVDRFESESAMNAGDMLLGQEPALRNNQSVIVSCQLRRLDEIRKVLDDPEVDVDRLAAWNYIARGVATGYETVSFPAATRALKSLAEKWQIADQVRLPKMRRLSGGGLRLEQGAKRTPRPGEDKPPAEGQKQPPKPQGFDRITFNGNDMKFDSIIDAVRLVHSALTPLESSGNTVAREYGYKCKDRLIARLQQSAKRAMSSGKTEAAMGHLSKLLHERPYHIDGLRMMGDCCIALERWSEAEVVLAQVLTFRADAEVVETYTNVLSKLGYDDMAADALEGLIERGPKNEGLRALRDKLQKGETAEAAQ